MAKMRQEMTRVQEEVRHIVRVGTRYAHIHICIAGGRAGRAGTGGMRRNCQKNETRRMSAREVAPLSQSFHLDSNINPNSRT